MALCLLFLLLNMSAFAFENIEESLGAFKNLHKIDINIGEKIIVSSQKEKNTKSVEE